MVVNVVEGDTALLAATIQVNGAALLIQDFTVALVARKKDGTVKTLAGVAANNDDGTVGNRGKVQFSPAATDFLVAESPYAVRWKITDGGLKIAHFPGGAADAIRVSL